MADTTWLTTLGPQFVAGVDPSNAAAVSASIATMTASLAAATDAQGDQLRNSFVASTMGASLNAASGAQAALLAPVTSGVQQVQALLQAPLVVLSQLQAAAEPLRLAARTAWQGAAAAGQTARTLERVERAAAGPAGSGSPVPVGVWALARQADALAIETAEAASRVGSAADQAWASAQRVIDDLRSAVAGPISSVSSVLTDTVRLMTSVPGSAGSAAAYSALHSNLQTVFNTVLPGG